MNSTQHSIRGWRSGPSRPCGRWARTWFCSRSQIEAVFQATGALAAATDAPYASAAPKLPTSLDEALQALRADTVLTAAFGEAFVNYFERVKLSELSRWEQAEDKDDFQRLEYFSRM